jgi:hypothetical protein
MEQAQKMKHDLTDFFPALPKMVCSGISHHEPERLFKFGRYSDWLRPATATHRQFLWKKHGALLLKNLLKQFLKILVRGRLAI